MIDDSHTPVLVKRDGPRGWHRINKKDFDPKRHEIYVPPVVVPPPPPLPPPPPPPPGPLDSLPKNWRDLSFKDLKPYAAAASGGRTPDNHRQAVELIAAALKVAK